MKSLPPILLMAILLGGLSAPAAALDLVEASNEIERLLQAGKFKKAGALAEECIAAAPEDIGFLSKRSMALYGQGRADEAEALRDEILDLWTRRYRDNWVARGSPRGEAAWARMILPAKRYHVYLAEYYEPQILTLDGVEVRVPYKFVAIPKDRKGNAGRVFKFEARRTSGGGEIYSLREVLEAVHKLAIPYGPEEPELQDVAAETVEYLNKGW